MIVIEAPASDAPEACGHWARTGRCVTRSSFWLSVSAQVSTTSVTARRARRPRGRCPAEVEARAGRTLLPLQSAGEQQREDSSLGAPWRLEAEHNLPGNRIFYLRLRRGPSYVPSNVSPRSVTIGGRVDARGHRETIRPRPGERQAARIRLFRESKSSH